MNIAEALLFLENLGWSELIDPRWTIKVFLLGTIRISELQYADLISGSLDSFTICTRTFV